MASLFNSTFGLEFLSYITAPLGLERMLSAPFGFVVTLFGFIVPKGPTIISATR